jgi:hypothetical protein
MTFQRGDIAYVSRHGMYGAAQTSGQAVLLFYATPARVHSVADSNVIVKLAGTGLVRVHYAYLTANVQDVCPPLPLTDAEKVALLRSALQDLRASCANFNQLGKLTQFDLTEADDVLAKTAFDTTV